MSTYQNDQNNPFNHVYTDPSGIEIPVASMDKEMLLACLTHFLITKPEYDLADQSQFLLDDYAPDGLDPDAAMTLGLRVPTLEEQRQAENRLIEIKQRIKRDAIKVGLPFMLLGLSRDDTAEEAKKIVQKFTKIVGPIKFRSQGSEVLQLLPGPAVQTVDDFEANSNSAE